MAHFRLNRHLLADLPALGAAVIEQWAKDAHAARLMILVVRHTFGRHLNFNPHLHILVSADGLSLKDDSWISGVRFEVSALMKRWRYTLVTYLREAHHRELLASDLSPQTLRGMLTTQYERWWSIDVLPCTSKEHFIRYAGRYVRRPPLAQYRILNHTLDEVQFRTRDHKLKKEVVTRYSPGLLVGLLAEHVQDHYKHAIRHFGLLSPRARGATFGALFAQLGQVRRQKPKGLTWAGSIKREFGNNPLLDSSRERMIWIARRPPLAAPFPFSFANESLLFLTL